MANIPNDLVSRLRAIDSGEEPMAYGSVLLDAANEIERLRGPRPTWAQVCKQAESEEGIDKDEWMNAAARHIENQRREINRLKEQLSALKDVSP